MNSLRVCGCALLNGLQCYSINVLVQYVGIETALFYSSDKRT